MGESTPPAAPPGWYPDPSGAAGQQRYWDGQKWDAVPPQAQTPLPAGTTRGGKLILVAMAAVAVFALITIVADGSDDSDPVPVESAPGTQLGPAPGPPTARATAVPTKRTAPIIPCSSAPAAVVDIIDNSFADGGVSQLRNAQAVELPDAMTYIGADIYQGDKRVSSWDRWLLSGGAVFAISPDARRRTLLPDGRDLLPMDDFDYREALDACVLQQSQG